MAGDTEEPQWTLIEKLGDVELRQYGPLVQARTSMPPGRSSSSGFRQLADYIFGGNAREQSIAMTAPVEQTLQDDGGYMAFTMPAEHALEDLPQPDDDAVSLHAVPARTVAAISFSGWATSGKVEAMTGELLDTLEQHGIEPQGPPSLNQYNPPWTPPWKRRNEIVVEIAPRQ
jgi:hypothetical protein